MKHPTKRRMGDPPLLCGVTLLLFTESITGRPLFERPQLYDSIIR